MEQATIAALLERYWQAETTVEEERLLADYFRQPVIAPEWEPWRPVFTYFEAEAQLTPGADFESKLMERIRQAEEAARPPLFYKTRWCAAAGIVLLGLGIFLVTQ